jgi:hypothetical protein
MKEIHTIHTGNRQHPVMTDEQCDLAREYGQANGYEWRKGGWIYRKSDGQHVAHGWGMFYLWVGRQRLEAWKRNT